jgi:RNA polymerase sigma factor (sigma-70 family)
VVGKLGGHLGQPQDELADEDVAQLAIRARAGDRAAMTRLLDRYRPLLISVARRSRRVLPVGVERGDVEQEASKCLCELVHAFDPTRGTPLGAYLKAKLGWRVAHYLRAEARRSGHRRLEDLDVEEIAGSVVEDPEPGVANPRVVRALRRLSPRQRAVIAGIFWRERTTRELAAELKVKPPAVTALRRRAERSLRDDLGS